MVVTLIGYRGTGKSAVARPLAARLDWEAVDADAEIERRAGKSIAAMFSEEGEAAFRALERRVVHELLQRDGLVLATGGGAILDPDTRRELRQAGPVVWLTASVDTILTRLAADDTTGGRRPNLTTSGGRDEVAQLLCQREPLYRQTADVIVDTEGRPLATVIEEVFTALGPLLQQGAVE